ncbi:MAG: tripartite tricarboxylate transporter substrate binding protein [Candidatus Methylomirabilota bacterium]
MRTRFLIPLTVLAAAVVLLSGMTDPAAAQQFTKPIRIIVPYAPGGSSDILARLMSPHLSKALGQPVVVENKTGASGNIGADFVAKAEKDGHTMLITDVGTLAAAPSLFSKLTFDVEKDLTPVGMVMFASYILGAHPSLPVKNVAELVAYAKANPGKLALAHSGVGSVGHLTGYVLAKHWGIDWKFVPYKGGAAAIRAVVANESNVIINGALATQPFVTQNQIRGIAVSGTKRLAALKDTPTFKELNLPAVESGTWQGIVTTGGTPAPVVARLNAELRKVLAMPEIQQKIEAQGGEVRIGSPEEFGAWMKGTMASWGAVVREAGIKVE